MTEKFDTPEGTVEITDTDLVHKPADDGPELRVSLVPMPEYSYQRGLYGSGTLELGEHVVAFKNEDAARVIEELRRPRKATKSEAADTSAARDSVVAKPLARDK